MANMQVYDIVILILVGWLTLRGAMKGMVSQLASIAAVIASFWAAVRFGPVLQPIMVSTFNAQSPWDKVLAISIAFVGASIAVMFLKSIVAKIISAIRMNKFDRLCGALFGFLKGVLICMIITFFAVMLSEQTRELATQSHSGKILVHLIQRTQTLLPEDVSALIESNLQGFQQQITLGKEMTEGTIGDATATSKALSDGRKLLETIQSGLTNLEKHFSDSPDPADSQPSLPTSVTQAKQYQLPPELQTTISSRPTLDMESVTGTTSDSVNFSISPNSPVLTIPANTPVSSSTPIIASAFGTSSEGIVAPSADLPPMPSTATPAPLPVATDWRTLFREMK